MRRLRAEHARPAVWAPQLLASPQRPHRFNEPAPEFPRETHCVELTESTINANSRLFDSIDDVPREAYTMGIGTIMAAKEILVVANGSDKADIVRRAFFAGHFLRCPPPSPVPSERHRRVDKEAWRPLRQ